MTNNETSYIARLFLAKNPNLKSEDLLLDLRKWLGAKIAEAVAQRTIDKAKGTSEHNLARGDSINVNWAESLSRAGFIAYQVRELLGVPEQTVASSVEKMDMKTYAQNRKNLGVKDAITY